jgi:hypothetical protein
MQAIGRLTTLAITALAALGLVVAARSIPDVKRYLDMRRM